MLAKLYETFFENDRRMRKLRLVDPEQISDAVVEKDGLHIFLKRGIEIFVKDSSDLDEAAEKSDLFLQLKETLNEWEETIWEKEKRRYEEIGGYGVPDYPDDF